MHLRDYVALLRRTWLTLVACTLIGASVGAVVTLMTPPVYESTARVFVAVRTTGAAHELALGTNYARQAVVNYVEVVPTDLVLQPVIDELDLDLTVNELASRVSAAAPLNTQLVTITVADSNPSRTAQLANAISASFAKAVTTELEQPAAGETRTTVRVDTVSPARVPMGPSSPNLRLNLLLGLLLGLATGIGIVVLRRVLDTRVHTITDVEDALDVPLLGGIPIDPDAATQPLVVHSTPRDPRAESFRALRTNVQFLGYDAETPSFVVTSAAPSEGKSTTCANLALALAETGARVALVDADLRKPRVAELFAIEGGVGLSDVLAGRVALSAAMQPWGAGKLFLLPAGVRPPNPSELLGSAMMRRALDEMQQAFDYILIDTPPVLAVTDAVVVSRFATGTILVAASGATRRAQLASARTAIETVDARLVGAVLTKLPTTGPDSYAYGQYTYGVTYESVG